MKFKCWSWKVMESYIIKKNKINRFFCKENSRNLPKVKDDFQGSGQI